jgi:hypothetical protein
MVSIIPEYRNRNLLVKWINSHQHHTCVYMGTVLFPFSYIIEQSKAPNSVSQSSPTHVFLLSFVTHGEYREVLHFPILTRWHARVSIYPRMEILSSLLPQEWQRSTEIWISAHSDIAFSAKLQNCRTNYSTFDDESYLTDRIPLPSTSKE